MRKMRTSLPPQENKGLRRFHRTKTRKMREMRTRKHGKCGKCGWLALMCLALGDPHLKEPHWEDRWVRGVDASASSLSPVGSFSNSWLELATEGIPIRETKNAWKHHCFQAFWCPLPLTHQSEKHRLENTICYSLLGNGIAYWHSHSTRGFSPWNLHSTRQFSLLFLRQFQRESAV